MTWKRYSIGGKITAEAAEELQEILNDAFGGACSEGDDVAEAIAEGRAISVAGHDPEDGDLDAFIDEHNLSFHYTDDDDDRGGDGRWRAPDGTTGEFYCDGEGDPILSMDSLKEAAKKKQSAAELLAEMRRHEGNWMPPLTITAELPPIKGSAEFTAAMAAALDPVPA